MLQRINVGRIMQRLMKNGGEWGDLFFEKTSVTRISHEDNRLEKIVTGTDTGVGVRLIKNFRTLYAWTNSPEEKTLLTLATRLSELSKSAALPGASITELKKVPPITEVKISPESYEFKKKIEKVLQAKEGAHVANNVSQIRVNYQESSRIIQIANCDGEFFENPQTYVLLAVQVVLSRNGKLQMGYETEGGTMGVEILNGDAPRLIGERAGKRALLMLDAQKAPGGRMPVVLSSEAGGTMIHEAVGHGLEADLAMGGLSVYSGKIGEQIASPLVSVVDNPTIPGKRGSYAIDDEGIITGETVLVEEGILKNYLFDRLQAIKNSSRSTGNGRRESYRQRPIPRMSNTIISPGETSPGEIIRSVTRGLLVKKMGGGQVNTVTGDFVFEVSEGYLIKNGKIGEPVRGATLTGNGPEILEMIDLVGTDLGYGIGTCGKDGQGVPVADAQPTLRIGEPYITVGGTAD